MNETLLWLIALCGLVAVWGEVRFEQDKDNE